MSILRAAAKIFPDEILRKIVSYVPGRNYSIYKTGWIEMTRRLNEDPILRSRFKTTKTLWCHFRRGKNTLKTAAAMTYEDPWYGACHLVMLPLQNKNDAMAFRMTRWGFIQTATGFVYEMLSDDKIFFRFQNRKEKTIHIIA